jgi:tetratricopeptide (TPR) repeat protein
MKKKAAAKVKRSASKPKKTKTVPRKSKRASPAPRTPQRPPSIADDPRFSTAVQNYQAGLKAMQERKFERAKALLQKVVEGPSRELGDRAAVHLNTCNQQMARSSTSFKTSEEHYDYAVALMNQGNYDEARSHLEKILKQNAKADYAIYGLAVLDCLQGRVEDSLRHLDQAIRLNPAHRIHARNDTDFQNLADDPRFTELLYPEPGSEAPSALSSGKR